TSSFLVLDGYHDGGPFTNGCHHRFVQVHPGRVEFTTGFAQQHRATGAGAQFDLGVRGAHRSAPVHGVEGDRAGRGDVERIHPAGHGDPHRLVGGGDGLFGQSGAFGPEQHRYPTLLGVGFPQRDGVGARGEGQDPEVVVFEQFEVFGPAVQAGEGHAEHVAHGDPDAAPVQRVGAAGAEQDAVDAEGGGVAEDGAEVLVVADAFQHCEAARVGDQVGGLDGRGAVGHGQHSAVEVEADDFGHDFGGGRVGGHVEGGERVGQFVDAAAHSEQGSHRVGGGEESFDDHDSFGYDQSAAAGPVRAAVGSRQVAEVVDPGIVGIGNL